MSKHPNEQRVDRNPRVSLLENLEQRRMLSAAAGDVEPMFQIRAMIEAGTHSPLEALAMVRQNLGANQVPETSLSGTPIVQPALPETSTSGTDGVAATEPSFSVFSGMRHVPDGVSLEDEGVDDILITYGDLFGRGPNGELLDDMVAEHRVREFARRAADSGRKWVVDIEHWAHDINKADEATVQETMDKFLQLIEWAKDERPHVEIGIYGIMPIRNYWTPNELERRTAQLEEAKADGNAFWIGVFQDLVDTEQSRYDKWENANDFLQPLADQVDFIVPSLYTFYDNPEAWETYAEHNLEQAASYGKPVIPFLMPHYHNAGPLTGEMNGEDFRAQLDFVRDNADGVVIWRGFSAWDTGEGWWQATTDFTAALAAEQIDVDSDGGDGTGTVAGTGKTPDSVFTETDEEAEQKEKAAKEQAAETARPDRKSVENQKLRQASNYRVQSASFTGVPERVVSVGFFDAEEMKIAVSRVV